MARRASCVRARGAHRGFWKRTGAWGTTVMGSPIERLLSGEGAKSVVFVWGVYRGVEHLYRKRVFSKDVSSIDFVTLCKKSIRPKGGKTWEQLGHMPEACTRCLQQYIREQVR